MIRKERIQFPNRTVSTRGGTSSGRSSCFTSEAKPRGLGDRRRETAFEWNQFQLLFGCEFDAFYTL